MLKLNHIITMLSLVLLLPLTMDAQRNCGSMDVLEQQQAENPALIQKMLDIEARTQDFIKNENATARATKTIPVVVHVLYKTNAQNISDAQIQSQIDVLNADFQRTNSDANNQWSQAAGMDIEFCLASVDPNGNSTNGITRKSTNKKSWRTNDDMKKSSRGGVDPWPTGDYLNMWVCNLSNSILGYAQFPGGNPATDGVVMLYSAFGDTGNVGAPFDLGRTTTHEVGHWLNLRHIWGDGGCSVDDFVSDTPTSDAANYGCAAGHVSCSSTDMVENYMDYSNDACMNLFTQGQVNRMNAIFASDALRASLLNSGGCGGGSNPPTATCTDGIQNQGETGVDCGGPCDPCNNPPAETCSDGIQNQGETGVDCGGPCAPCNTGVCAAPSNLSYTSRKGGRDALLRWNAASGANNYTVQLRQAGGSWTTATASGTSITFTGLTKNRNYEWQVRSNCSSGSSAYSTGSFTAGISNRLSANYQEFTVYPNPSSNNITVEYSEVFEGELIPLSVVENAKETAFIINVMDLSGKVVLSKTTNDTATTFDINQLSNGMYFIQILQDGQLINTQKFIKQGN